MTEETCDCAARTFDGDCCHRGTGPAADFPCCWKAQNHPCRREGASLPLAPEGADTAGKDDR